MIAEHRGFADVWNMLGVIHHEHNRFVEAEGAFAEALKINPSYTDAALNLAITLDEPASTRRAREVYAKAIARTRSEPRAIDPFAKGKIANMHADLGAAYAAVGLYPESVREYMNALTLCPTFVDPARASRRSTATWATCRRRCARSRRCASSTRSTWPGASRSGSRSTRRGSVTRRSRSGKTALTLEPEHRAARVFMQMVREDKP